ncbi:hypothetical protein CARUB_v10028621mg [Capsella rubella]|uniref:Uncharacterized protein n=1 Tax=Capsella rubella TaxID=81985 RepID=R0F0U0_9BRAS|nr:precursor of CEP5 [Capsella rubella]EOA15227.1 hypothetical protein CARUB_v10028621mg [Capsella rubella]
MESSMGQKKTLYACVFLMMVFFLDFNCVHGRTLKDIKINDGPGDSKRMMAVHNDLMVDEKAVQFSPPPPPSSQSSEGKGPEDFRPTRPGNSPGIGHSLPHT